MKKARVRSRLTLERVAELVRASISAVHRLEQTGEGSDDLRARVGAVLGLDLSKRAPLTLDDQLVLPSGSSS